MTWVDDLIGIVAISSLFLLIALVMVTLGMALVGLTPFSWTIPVIHFLTGNYAVMVVISELI